MITKYHAWDKNGLWHGLEIRSKTGPTYGWTWIEVKTVLGPVLTEQVIRHLMKTPDHSVWLKDGIIPILPKSK